MVNPAPKIKISSATYIKNNIDDISERIEVMNAAIKLIEDMKCIGHIVSNEPGCKLPPSISGSALLPSIGSSNFMAPFPLAMQQEAKKNATKFFANPIFKYPPYSSESYSFIRKLSDQKLAEISTPKYVPILLPQMKPSLSIDYKLLQKFILENAEERRSKEENQAEDVDDKMLEVNAKVLLRAPALSSYLDEILETFAPKKVKAEALTVARPYIPKPLPKGGSGGSNQNSFGTKTFDLCKTILFISPLIILIQLL